MDDVIIKIKFDGDLESLKNHRLSISDFNKPLKNLLQAYREKAYALTDYLEQGNISKKRMEFFDLEIQSISEGCTTADLVCTHNNTTSGFFDITSEEKKEAATAVLDDIEKTSQGKYSSEHIRKFFKNIPKEVSYQEYKVCYKGEVVKEVNISAVDIAELKFPCVFEKIQGHIVQVGFDPGKQKIKIKCHKTKREIEGIADKELVEKAISFRNTNIKALFVKTNKRFNKNRCLWIKDTNEQVCKMNQEEKKEYILKRWGNVLDRLSK